MASDGFKAMSFEFKDIAHLRTGGSRVEFEPHGEPDESGAIAVCVKRVESTFVIGDLREAFDIVRSQIECAQAMEPDLQEDFQTLQRLFATLEECGCNEVRLNSNESIYPQLTAILATA